jgi:hypothetical protein
MEVIRVATHIDFDKNPAPFYGVGIRGVTVGVQVGGE